MIAFAIIETRYLAALEQVALTWIKKINFGKAWELPKNIMRLTEKHAKYL